MKPVHHTAEDISGLDELVADRVEKLSEKLARTHTLKDLESEVRILDELIQSFKFRDELLKRLAREGEAVSPRKRAADATAKREEVARRRADLSGELISRSHRLIKESGRLFSKLAIERSLSGSPLAQHRNRLLAALPAGEYVKIIPLLERVSVSLGKVVHRPGEPIRYAYFPETAVFSVVATMKNGATVEVGVVGKEGMLGVRLLSGGNVTPNQTVAEVSGTVLRMREEALREEAASGGPLQKLLLWYSQFVITQSRQSAACKNFHSVESRLARWLLTIQDRTEARELILTQSQMAQAMGSRLAGVSEAASRLQRAQVIRYSRGHIVILDRPALEAAACECYRVLGDELRQLYREYFNSAR